VVVWASGVIKSEWNRPREGSDSEALKSLLGWVLPAHRQLYEANLRHRGDVAVAAAAHWQGGQAAFVAKPPVSLEEFTSPPFKAQLDRQIDRSQGYYVLERE
jgi:hypothetical protein